MPKKDVVKGRGRKERGGRTSEGSVAVWVEAATHTLTCSTSLTRSRPARRPTGDTARLPPPTFTKPAAHTPSPVSAHALKLGI